MILSVSRRTDIPCHYPHWFMNRLKAGYLLAPNPYNPTQGELLGTLTGNEKVIEKNLQSNKQWQISL